MHEFEIEIDGDLSFDWLFNSTDVNGGLFEVAMYRNGDLYGDTLGRAARV